MTIVMSAIDGAGIYGSTLHYALVIAFVASAMIIFVALWRKGRLDMDESPKFQMMREGEQDERDEK